MIWTGVLVGALIGAVALGLLSLVIDDDGPIIAFGVVVGAVLGGGIGALVVTIAGRWS